MKQLNHFMTRFSFLPGMNYKQFENYIKEESQFQHVLNRAPFVNLISCFMAVGVIPGAVAWLLNIYSKTTLPPVIVVFTILWILTGVISLVAASEDFFADNEKIKKTILLSVNFFDSLDNQAFFMFGEFSSFMTIVQHIPCNFTRFTSFAQLKSNSYPNKTSIEKRVKTFSLEGLVTR